MDPETKIIIAFLFKRSGKEKLSYSDLYLTLSMDLKWFSPETAKAFIDDALAQKILTKKGELIKTNFDLNEIKIPVGFTPTKKNFLEKEKVTEEEILEQIIKKIIEKTGLDETQVNEKINKIAHEQNLTPEVASLLAGKEYNVELKEFYKEVEEEIIKKV